MLACWWEESSTAASARSTSHFFAQVDIRDINGGGHDDIILLFQAYDPSLPPVSIGLIALGELVPNKSDPQSWANAIEGVLALPGLTAGTPQPGGTGVKVLPLAEDAAFFNLLDSDDDGIPEIEVVNLDGTTDLIRINGDQVTERRRVLNLDATGDGSLDRVEVYRDVNDRIRWASLHENGQNASSLPVAYNEPLLALPVDLSGDGDEDVVVSSGGSLVFLTATGGGGFIGSTAEVSNVVTLDTVLGDDSVFVAVLDDGRVLSGDSAGAAISDSGFAVIGALRSVLPRGFAAKC